MNILLTFAANKTDIIKYFKNAIGNTGKVFAGDCTFNYSLTKADGYLITPEASDDSYISVLTDYCKENNISAIIPFSDMDLLVLSKNKNKLQNTGISVVISNESLIEICVDRWKTHLFLESKGLKHPKTHIDLDEVKRELGIGTLSFPLYLIPRFKTEIMVGVQVNNLEELYVFYRKIQKKTLNKSDNNDNIIIQEIISYDKYGFCLLNDLQGNNITSVSLKKLDSSFNDTFEAQVEDSKPFEKIIILLTSELKHIAYLEVNCGLHESSDVIVSDICPRFGYNYPFWHVTGANFPKQIVDWLNGLPVSPDNINPIIGAKGGKEYLSVVPFDFE